MAIVVEGQSNRGGLISTIVAVVLILLLGIGTYYLFFTEPPQIEVIAPPGLQTISQISEVQINPSGVMNSPEFQALREHVSPPVLGSYGRANPFARF